MLEEVTAAALGCSGWTLGGPGCSAGLPLVLGGSLALQLLLLGIWLMPLWGTSFSGSLSFGPGGVGHFFMTASTTLLPLCPAVAQTLWGLRNAGGCCEATKYAETTTSSRSTCATGSCIVKRRSRRPANQGVFPVLLGRTRPLLGGRSRGETP